MGWTLAHPLHDVEDIVNLADVNYGSEIDGILKRDRNVFRHRVTVATTEQIFNKSREFIAVCRGQEGKLFFSNPDKLLGFCWFDRGGYTTYSNEEISNAKFHHVDLSLSARTRVLLINQMIDQHVLWANNYGIPIICSTSIRAEHDGFMKIHKKRGFTVNGSYAWIRTEEAMKCLTNQ
jgi:hypothetical protein